MIYQAKDLSNYFHETILRYSKKTNSNYDESALYYIGEMLANFSYQNKDKSLIVELSEIVESESLGQSAEIYRNMGDKCLFISSFRDGQLNKKMKDKHFCNSLGSYTYGKASLLYKPVHKNLSSVLATISEDFERLSSFLHEMFSKEPEFNAFLRY